MNGSKIITVVLITLIMLASGSLEAKRTAIESKKSYNSGMSTIVVDAGTGRILHGENHHAQRYPASLTKMMTLYLTFEALDQGKISIKKQLPVSKHASIQSPSKLWLKAGDSISVRDAILGLVIKSANDASVVLAEGLAGSHEAFAQRMTAKAHALGMRNTTFKNANGWHNPGQKTTAHDMAILLKSIIKKYPRYYKYFNTRSFSFKGNQYHSRNRLLGKYPGMDGGKTGFTCPSGFNLAASALRSGNRLVAVVLGGTSIEGRNSRMVSILDKSFGSMGRGTYAEPELENSDPEITPVVAVSDPVDDVDTPAPAVTRQYPARMVKNWTPVPQLKPMLNIKPEAPVDVAKSKAKKIKVKGDWGVQVGAYSQLPAAKKRGKDILSRFDILNSANVQISPIVSKGKKKKKVYRTRIENIPREKAHQVCKALKGKKEECLVFHK